MPVPGTALDQGPVSNGKALDYVAADLLRCPRSAWSQKLTQNRIRIVRCAPTTDVVGGLQFRPLSRHTVPRSGPLFMSRLLGRFRLWLGILILVGNAAGLFQDHPHITVFPGDGIDVMPVVTGPPED